jgi:RND family efflux transporter MFP subunit
MEWIDSVRLPKVDTIVVARTTPLAASAVSGTAANGYVIAGVKAALSADTPGRIVEMNVVEGMVVKKGFVVARLYSDEYRAAVRRADADLAAQDAAVERGRAQAQAARADAPRLKAELSRAQALQREQTAAVDLAKVKLERAEKMLAENIWTTQARDDAKTELDRTQAALEGALAGVTAAESAVAQIGSQVAALDAAVKELEARKGVIQAEREQAQATLDKTEVRAPFDGIVVLKDAEVGEVVSPNSQGGNSRGSVATMVDWSSLEVQVELQETSLSVAKVDAPASIYLDAYPEHLYPGVVRRIWPTANRQKATVEVRVGFVAPDDKLRPEMGARVVFGDGEHAAATPAEGTAEPAMLVPRNAIVRTGGADYVFVVERDVARTRKVELGAERSGRVIVKSGLTEGERIVSDPPNSLQDGERVRLTP